MQGDTRSIGVRAGHGHLAADLVVDSLADLLDDALDCLLATPLHSPAKR